MAGMTYKEVTEAELRSFVKTYPRKLQFDINGIFQPPLAGFYDFSIGVGPAALVAWFKADDPARDFYVRTDLPPADPLEQGLREDAARLKQQRLRLDLATRLLGRR